MMRPLLVVENGTIDRMIENHAIYPQFRGCLDLVVNAAPAKGCQKCRKAGAKDPGAYNQAKLCLAQLTGESRQALLTAMDSRQLRFMVIQNGQRKTYTLA